MADDLPDWNLNILDPMDDDSKSRFIDVSKDDVDELIAQNENENTKKKAMYDLNIVLKFLREVRKEERELEKISPEELNVYLIEFIIAATILDKIKWNSKPPSPQIKDEAARRAKTRHFPIFDLGGRGGQGFPFILSKIVERRKEKNMSRLL